MAGDALWADAVDAVVAPATAFGGAGVLSLADQVGTVHASEISACGWAGFDLWLCVRCASIPLMRGDGDRAEL